VIIRRSNGEAFPLDGTGEVSAVSAARLEGDGRGLWVGRSSGPLRRHELSFESGRPVLAAGAEISGNDGYLPTALHRASGLLALTNYREGNVRILDTRTRTVQAGWPLPRASHAEFSPDGRWVLSNAEPTPGGRAEVRETATGRVVFSPGEKAGRVAAWSADGRWLLAGTDRDKVGVWHTGSWQPGPPLPGDVQSSNLTGTFSPDGRWLVMRGDDELRVYRTGTMDLLARIPIPGSVAYVAALTFTPDGETLIAVRLDGRVDLWNFRRLRAELVALGLDWTE
jgi:WD40 repeat protein